MRGTTRFWKLLMEPQSRAGQFNCPFLYTSSRPLGTATLEARTSRGHVCAAVQHDSGNGSPPPEGNRGPGPFQMFDLDTDYSSYLDDRDRAVLKRGQVHGRRHCGVYLGIGEPGSLVCRRAFEQAKIVKLFSFEVWSGTELENRHARGEIVGPFLPGLAQPECRNWEIRCRRPDTP